MQEQLRTIAFARDLLSLELCFDGDGDLSRDELREIDIEIAISANFLTPEVQRAEFLMDRAQRDAAD